MATSRGASHYTHWFQPQTGLTAEKHDSCPRLDENKQPIEQFSGSQLIRRSLMRRPSLQVGCAAPGIAGYTA